MTVCQHYYWDVRSVYFGTYIRYEKYCTTCGTVLETWTVAFTNRRETGVQ